MLALLRRLRKKEQAKANKPQQRRRRLLVCSRWLPYGLQREPVSGALQLVDAMASSRSSKVAAYETVLHRFDVTWVGCPSEDIAPEEVDPTPTPDYPYPYP